MEMTDIRVQNVEDSESNEDNESKTLTSDDDEDINRYGNVNNEDQQQHGSKENLCKACGFERRLMPYQNFFFWFYARVGAISPYWSLYFKQLGLVPWQIGVIAGVRPFAGFACGPLWGMVADKFNIHRQLLYFCIVGFSMFIIALANVPTSSWTEKNCHEKHLTCPATNISTSSLNSNVSCAIIKLDQDSKERLLEIRDWMFEEDGLHRVFATMVALSIFGQFLDMPINSLADTESLQLLGRVGLHKYGFIRRPGGVGLGIL